ncbi:hypothetical protein niasHT_028440 [Heterodera trifolii]|uniref:Uncharacterized protein n=1 Tax=Heterodera trifolii TaxID=157864 RepID=A0ABD2JKT2_9BILA
MDLILATDWIHNAYPEMDQQDHNKEPPKIDQQQQDHNKKRQKTTRRMRRRRRSLAGSASLTKSRSRTRSPQFIMGRQEQTCACAERPRPIPLVEHLCKRFNCSAHELHVLFRNLEKRETLSSTCALLSCEPPTCALLFEISRCAVTTSPFSTPTQPRPTAASWELRYFFGNLVDIIKDFSFWLLHNVELIQNIIHAVFSTQSSCESGMEQKLWLHSYFNRHVSSSLEFHTLIKPKSLQQEFYDEFNTRKAEQ